jgi:hypothetical protein
VSCLLQTASGDLDFSAHNLTLVTDEDTSIAQKLTNRFQLFLGEWFLDTRVGVPWFQNILGLKNPDMASVGQLLARVITQTPGVASIQSSQLNFISTTRQLLANFVVQTQAGAVLTGGMGQPFIVTKGSQASQ